ncbi:MAG: WD40 repeat domain-containing protein [Desulfobacterales bacterium]|nr:WD40 repeat domain-containing protein [Desulfobacterales bacterium]
MYHQYIKMNSKNFFLCFVLLSIIISSCTFLQRRPTDSPTPPPSVFFRNGHSDEIIAISASQDGRFLVTGSIDKTVRVWDITTAKEINTFKGNEMSVCGGGFAEPEVVVSGSHDTSVRWWDMKTDRELFRLNSEQDTIYCMDVSRDGKYAVTGHFRGNIRLWDLKERKLIQVISGHTERIHFVAFNTDGNRILSCARDETVKIWDTQHQNLIHTINGRVRAACFDTDSNYVLAGYADALLCLIDLNTGSVTKTYQGAVSKIFTVAVSADGNRVMSASVNGDIRIWDKDSGKEVNTYNAAIGDLSMASFFPEKDWVFLSAGKFEPKVVLMDLTNGNPLKTFENNQQRIFDIALSKDGNYLVSGGHRDGKVKIWDISNGRMISAIDIQKQGLLSVALSPDGNFILSGGSDQQVKVWDKHTLQLKQEYKVHQSPVISVAYSSNNKLIAAGCWDGSIYIWNTETGKLNAKIPGKGKAISKILFQPQTDAVFASSMDGTINLIDSGTGSVIKSVIKLTMPITSIAITQDGNTIFYNDSGPILKSFALDKGEIQLFRGHIKEATAFGIDEQGQFLLTGDKLGCIRLFDIKTEKILSVMRQSGTNLIRVAFIPNQKRSVTVDIEGTQILWDIETGKEMCRFVSFKDGDWAILTAQGLFTGSDNAASYLNFYYNNQLVTGDSIVSLFNRPDLVKLKLTHGSDEKFDKSYKKILRELETILPKQ